MPGKPVHAANVEPQAASRAWIRTIALFFLGWLMIYVTRSVLSPLLPVLEQEWGLNKQELGLISSAFFATYLLAQIPAGMLADRFGRKAVLVPSYICMALMASLSSVAGGLTAFLGLRAGSGLFQGTYFSTQFAWTTEAVPARWRVLGTTISNSGQPFGIALGYLAAGWLTLAPAGTPGAWRMPILITGLLALALGVGMTLWLKEPARGAPRPTLAGAADVLRKPSMWVLLLVEFCILYSFFVLVPWLPYYLEKTRGYEAETARWLATVMPFASVPAGIIWGRIIDRTGGRAGYMRIQLVLSAISLVAMVALPGTLGLLVGLVLYGFSGKMIIDPVLISAVADVVDPEDRAKALGFIGAIASAAMILAPWFTGFLADTQGSLNGAFYVAALLHLVAAAGTLAMRTAAKGG